MKTNAWMTLLALTSLCLSGCAYSVHELHTSDYDPGVELSQAKVVEAEAEQFVVMGFVTQTDYADKAFERLQGTCPQGRITGIQTRYSTSLGFFSWTNKVVMKGYCTP